MGAWELLLGVRGVLLGALGASRDIQGKAWILSEFLRPQGILRPLPFDGNLGGLGALIHHPTHSKLKDSGLKYIESKIILYI